MAKAPDPRSSSARGKSGETRACLLLEKKGLLILQRNFRTPRGEVDIIAMDRDTLCFVEVKTWAPQLWEDVRRAIGPRKRSRIRETARAWLATEGVGRSFARIRFDLFLLDSEGTDHQWLPGALDY